MEGNLFFFKKNSTLYQLCSGGREQETRFTVCSCSVKQGWVSPPFFLHLHFQCREEEKSTDDAKRGGGKALWWPETRATKTGEEEGGEKRAKALGDQGFLNQAAGGRGRIGLVLQKGSPTTNFKED